MVFEAEKHDGRKVVVKFSRKYGPNASNVLT